MASSKKITLLIAVPSLECGGLEKNVAFLANNLNQNKFRVHIVIINNSNPFFQITNPGVEITDLAAPGARKAMPALIKMANKLQPNILLSASNHLNLLCAIHKNKFPRGMKLLARESSIVSLNVRYGKFPWLYQQLLKHYYKKTDLIICQSAYMKTDLINHYGIPSEKVRVINNPVEMPDPPKENIPPYPVFISVGRLRPEKGMDDLLRAVSKLNSNFRFHLMGSGPEKEKLKSLASRLNLNDKLIFHGNRNAPFSIPEKPNLFLLGSHYEGFPNAVLEAGALGIPTIAYDAPGGISEIIHNEQNGFLVTPRNPELFAQTIQNALNFPFNREAISKTTLLKFSPATILTEWTSLFEEIIT